MKIGLNTNYIAFLDVEVEPKSKRILDIGCVKGDGSSFHSNSIQKFSDFLKDVKFVCGHNIIEHDLKYIGKTVFSSGLSETNVVDTLHLSPLLFPARPYHALLKDDKLQTEETNNPLNDSIKAKDLLNDEVNAFNQLSAEMKQLYFSLLKDKKEFKGFFELMGFAESNANSAQTIFSAFNNEICSHTPIQRFINTSPVSLAYCLSLINSKNRYSITPPWVLRNYPEVESIMYALRNKPCLEGCGYCNQALDIHKGLKKFFGFDAYRTYGGEPLQEKAVKAAVNGKSILAIFPTGGGKSVTFQVPALMSGESAKGLTVVISPLQSLMKDQVDNLEKIGITDAVTINGLLDPIERAKSYERTENGSASMIYLSPEALRSKSIEKLLLSRKIVRFVIDEAHCFSAWGHDFRVDYLYIGDFIKSLQEKKNLQENIPISCFTATAKPNVIEDIKSYFRDKLSIELEVFSSKASRTNLQYKVFQKEDEEQKYNAVRDLIEEKNCPTIIYVSRTRKTEMLAQKLAEDGFKARAYHGKMDVKDKTENQNAFISGEIPIMVATSAFGMGVDKKDVGLVIHYEISDSLENYIQEAGRAGRDEKITADCFVLFNEEDLSKHFILLNQTKLSIKEIQQIWKAIKEITRFRSTASNSALEIARKAGWDDRIVEIETRVTTAIAALEEAGYIKRGQNMPRIFANSILSKNAQEAIDKINSSIRFDEKQKITATRIIKKLFSTKSRKQASEEAAESRIDYISDHLGIVKEEVISIINLLREEKILADAKDLTAYIKRGENKNRSLNIVDSFSHIENKILPLLEEQESIVHLKELNEQLERVGCKGVNPNKLKTIINFWAIKNWIKRKNLEYSKNHIAIGLTLHKQDFKAKIQKRSELARFIVGFLYTKSIADTAEKEKDEVLVEFSVLGIKEAYEKSNNLFKGKVSIEEIEDALFFLSRIDAIKIEGGFLVIYNRLTIDRLEQNNKVQYKNDDYQKLNQFYEHKIQQIHIVGEYAKKMIDDYKGALQFVEDYFRLNYSGFLNKYFPGSRQNEIKRNITPSKFRQLFGSLSARQLEIIKDNESKYIVVAAGPGSGKTRVLVHKLASLLLMEDVKHEQLLMVTFSRAAATEFKKRLFELIGNAAGFVEVKTFHSFCFDLLGKVGTLEKSDDIIKLTVEKIRSGEVEPNRITKSVLVIDEAQDMDTDEFDLIKALIEHNDDMRVIAVGDDDQNIYAFRGASSTYMENLIKDWSATKHELIENYRSKANLVQFANGFLERIKHRLKEIPIEAKQTDSGSLKLIQYKSSNLIVPVVESIKQNDLVGTSCILCKTNDEASQITGLLVRDGINAKLIQSNDGFNLWNLAEIRHFISCLSLNEETFVIDEETWEKAKREMISEFKRSTKLELAINVVKDFEESNPKKKYKSDLEVFIRESRVEDFYNENGETIFVSTIHKTKGKEFDNVFLMLDNFQAETEEANRQIYVAITRAKTHLEIHTNGKYFDSILADALEKESRGETYTPPEHLASHLTLRDVILDSFIAAQPFLSGLKAGDTLIVRDRACYSPQGELLCRFSKLFNEKIDGYYSKGFQLSGAKVNFVLYWQKEYEDGSKKEFLVVLPEIILTRNKVTVKNK